MAINYGANYTGIDKERYDAGNQFYSQDRFLQGTGLDKPAITFNPSRSNTGIMSQYPRYPIIPQYGGDGDGGGPFGPKDLGEITADNYGKGVTDPTGMGYELTEEDMKNIQKQKNVNALRAIGKFGLMTMSPFGPINAYGIEQGINKVKDIFSGDGNTNDMGNLSQSGTYGGNATYSSDGSSVDSSTGDITGSDGTSQGNINDEFAYGGRVGYRDGGYSSEDNEEQQAQDQASFDAGNRTDDYNDMYSGDDNTPNQNPFYEPTNTSNLDFSLVKDINPAFSYANNVGRFGGMLDTTKTIEEEEPVGTVGYFSPSNNFGIGYDTNLGMVGKANLGNLNIGYTGQDGVNASYMGGFDGDAGRFGANYGKDGLEARITYNKKFNNGGIVGMYR